MSAQYEIDRDGLVRRLRALPGFEAARAAAERSGVEAYLVGGSVRDALLGLDRGDLDLVAAGDHLALAAELGGEITAHDRFGTATVVGETGSLDVARARSESYSRPGALPEVRPAGLEQDLARRDFTVNAMAVAVTAPEQLIDPHGGLADLRRGLLRALHGRSLADDPTRALRAARYAARLGLEVEPGTLTQVRATDLGTVSADRREAELRKLAIEPRAARGLTLLAEWGLIALPSGAGDLFESIASVTATAPWSANADRADVVLAALDPEALRRSEELARVVPDRPSEAVAAARGRSGTELALARALGAGWLDRYLEEWRDVRLQIGGTDLISAGIPEGEAIGRGLAAALRAKLDNDVSGRNDELRIALEGARGEA